MTPTEKRHLDKIREFWLDDECPPDWELDTDKYRAKMVAGKLFWFEFPKTHGWQRIKVEEKL